MTGGGESVHLWAWPQGQKMTYSGPKSYVQWAKMWHTRGWKVTYGPKCNIRVLYNAHQLSFHLHPSLISKQNSRCWVVETHRKDDIKNDILLYVPPMLFNFQFQGVTLIWPAILCSWLRPIDYHLCDVTKKYTITQKNVKEIWNLGIEVDFFLKM